MRHTPESAADEVAFIGRQAVPMFSDYYAVRIGSLTDWCDVDAALAPLIETHYEQYLQESGLAAVAG